MPDIDWPNTFVSGHSHSLRLNHIFLDFLLDNALTQMVNTPTRGSNVLDIFITDRPSLVESCDTVDGISDHEAVFIESLVTAHLTLPSRRTIYLWSQADLQNVKNRTGSLCEEFVSSYSSSIPVEILWNNFVRICDTCLDLVPTKLSSSSFKQPWITTHIKRLSRRKQRAYNYARKTNEAHQWSNYYNLRRECQRECRTAYNKYVSNMVDPNKNVVTKNYGPILKVRDKTTLVV